MYGQGIFFQAFVYLSAAVVSVPIAKRLGLGSVLGYLIAGMVIGPFGLGLIGEEGGDVMHFAEFGVVMMLFLIGLELRPSLLWRLRGPILGMGGLQVGVTAALISLIGIAVSLPWGTALALGMILALSSTAIVLQTLAEKGLMASDGGQGAFAVLLFQDIAVIPMLALLPLLAVTPGGEETAEAAAHGEAWVQNLPAWAETLAVLGAVAAIVVGGRFLLRPVFRFIARTHLREIFTAAALLLVIGIALLMAQVGLSPALGTFLAGVVLANSEYRHELEADIDPFKGLLLGVFFIAVGASVDFGLIAARPGMVAGLVAALILLKFAVLFVLGRVFRMGLDQNLLFALSLAQGGEFAFVLFSFATQHGVIGASIANPLIAVVAITMAVTPLLMLLNERLIQPHFGTRERQRGEPDAIDEHNPVIIAGFGRFGSVVGRLLRANGVGTTVLEYDSDHVELLRKLGLKVFYGDASRHDLLRSAGAERARLMILALDDHERTLSLVRTVQKHFPHLTLLARAAGRPEAYELLDAGVQHVYRETLDTSLRLGVDALRLLGARSYQAHRTARTFRRHDEESVIELAQMRHDRGRYISEARQRIQSLEQILLDELQPRPEDRDAGWDTDSLREEFGRSPPTGE
ncbi:MAG: monovalent cation:proton antiporter-2 (CPA2) family protein [Gemmatimonadales bacterium]|jgi:monovalent cation:proton antiporter-2 (CPA2) family protein